MNKQKKDGYDNHVGGNGILGEWGVTINLRSKSGTAYKDIVTNVTAYDANNQIIYNKIHTIPYLPEGLGESIFFSTGKTEPTRVTINIVNATREK